MITAYLVKHDHIEGSGGRALFVEASHMETSRVWPPVNKLVYGPLVAVKGKDDGLIFCEVLYEGGVIQPMGVDIWWVECHQVHHVHHAHLQFWNMVAQPPGGGNGLHGHDIPCTGQHDIRLNTAFITCPMPGGQAARAVFNRLPHVEELQVRLFIDDNQVHIITAAETMIGDREQAVCIWWEIDARYLAFS